MNLNCKIINGDELIYTIDEKSNSLSDNFLDQ